MRTKSIGLLFFTSSLFSMFTVIIKEIIASNFHFMFNLIMANGLLLLYIYSLHYDLSRMYLR